MHYQRITPFPPVEDYNFPELRALSSIWKEKKSELEESGAYKDFLKKLQREWAIETGIIERLYTWDRGVTEVLIEKGIESSLIAHKGGLSQNDAEQAHSIISDHVNIIEGLFGYIKGEEDLSEYFIRGLQAQFTEHQDHTEAITEAGTKINVSLIKGDYKKLPNNPRRPSGETHTYCPPELTKEEMERLIEIYRASEKKYPPEVKAAWLHHRFTQIHPFQDGNGRVARTLASLVFLKEGLFPLVVRDSDRVEYITGLEEADNGNLSPLVVFFAKRQKESLLKALGLEQQVQQGRFTDQIITSALTILKSKLQRDTQNIGAVYTHADKLLAEINEKFRDISNRLDVDLRKITSSSKKQYRALNTFADNKSPQRHFFQRQIIDAANQFDYYANCEPYRAWSRLSLSTEQHFEYVISLHGYGHISNGILVASAFTYLKAPKEEGGTEPVSLKLAATDIFQFNYVESFESISRRFDGWLSESITLALAEWTKTLRS